MTSAHTSFWMALMLCIWFVPVAIAAGLNLPTLSGRVVDQANILSPDEERHLTSLFADQDARTHNQVVVVTVSSLQGAAIEDYGYALGQKWGIGQKDRNNGIIVIVAPNQRKVRIVVGIGLERAITDTIAKRIIDENILPRFKINDMGGGVVQGVQSILLILDGETLAPVANSGGIDGGLIVFLIIGAAFGAFIFYRKRKRSKIRTYRNVGAHLQKSTTNKSNSTDNGGDDTGRGGPSRGGGGRFGGGGASGGW